MDRATAEHSAAQHAYLEEVGQVLDMEWVSVSSEWKCEASPLAYCVYDLTSEKGYDECVYCHQPNERK